MTLLLVGTRKGLFVMEPGADGSWISQRHAFLGVPVSAVCWDQRDNALYAALNHGHFGVKFHRSDDLGENWTELPAPAFPAGFPADEGKPAPSVSLIWTLEPGPRSGELWAGTIPGGLFHSADRGVSWQLNENLWGQEGRKKWFGGGYDQPGIHSILADPRDPRRLVVGVSCGGVWLSDDAGANWTLGGEGLVADYMPDGQGNDPGIQDVHRLARCTASPERVWTQHHNGIFRSDDGGRHWVRLSPAPLSEFGFAVAAHPSDPDTAWFAPAQKDEIRVPAEGRFAVTRTHDAGKSFERIEAGLPQPPCFDLVYRHSLEVAPDGRTLAMGSTTGSLWSSGDAGASWRLVNAHLPPIACVRFAV